MPLGLPARAKHAGHLTLGPGQIFGGNGTGGAGTYHAEKISFNNRLQYTRRRVKEVKQKTVAAAIGGVGLIANHPLRRQGALQHVQNSLWQTGTGARRVLRQTVGQVTMSRLYSFQSHAYGQQLFYIIFCKKNCHVGRS